MPVFDVREDITDLEGNVLYTSTKKVEAGDSIAAVFSFNSCIEQVRKEIGREDLTSRYGTAESEGYNRRV